MKKKYVLILILLLSVGGILLGRSLGRGGKVWRERARVLEAEKATADGLLVAARVNQAELLGKVETLGEQIDDLEVKLGEKPKIKTVIQTRTNPINVDAKLLLVEADAKIRALNEQIRADNEGRDDPCPECPDIETLLGGSTKDYFQFEIGNLSAELESEAGNTFLAGTGELFLTAPAALAGSLGSAAYRIQVSELFVSTPPRALPVHRYMVGVHWAALRDRQTQTISGYYDDSTASFDPESFRIMGAYRMFPKKKVSIQAGVFVDAASAGLHLGSSF